MAIVQTEMGRPADLAGIYLQGQRNQAAIGEARQRLDAQRAEVTARLQAESEQRAQERAVEQQRIAVTQAYHNQEIELRKQQLDEAAAMNQQKTLTAARAYQAKQDLQKAMDAIDADTTLNEAQRDAKKTTVIMRYGMFTGMPGTETASMITAVRPPKPNVPASVTDKGPYVLVTNPNGTTSLHWKPKDTEDKLIKVKTSVNPPEFQNVPALKVRATIAGLPEDVANDPFNKAVTQFAPNTPYDRTPQGKAMSPNVPQAASPGGTPNAKKRYQYDPTRDELVPVGE